MGVPVGSTIDGIVLEIKGKYITGRGNFTSMNCGKITVYYTEGGGSSAIKSVNGLAKASISKINDLAIASVKSINGL